MISGKALIQLSFLIFRQRQSFWNGFKTIPNILDQLNTFGNA